MHDNESEQNIRTHHRLEMIARIMRYALNVPAAFFLLLSVFVLKTTPWIVASGVTLLVAMLISNTLSLEVYKRKERAKNEATVEADDLACPPHEQVTDIEDDENVKQARNE